MVRWVFIAAYCVALWGGPAAADVVHFTCDDPTGCSYDEQLGKSITKEFRGYCSTTGVRVVPQNQQCQSRNENVTCTYADCDLSYCTCSCTNWSPTGRHPATIYVYC